MPSKPKQNINIPPQNTIPSTQPTNQEHSRTFIYARSQNLSSMYPFSRSFWGQAPDMRQQTKMVKKELRTATETRQRRKQATGLQEECYRGLRKTIKQLRLWEIFTEYLEHTFKQAICGVILPLPFPTTRSQGKNGYSSEKSSQRSSRFGITRPRTTKLRSRTRFSSEKQGHHISLLINDVEYLFIYL